MPPAAARKSTVIRRGTRRQRVTRQRMHAAPYAAARHAAECNAADPVARSSAARVVDAALRIRAFARAQRVAKTRAAPMSRARATRARSVGVARALRKQVERVCAGSREVECKIMRTQTKWCAVAVGKVVPVVCAVRCPARVLRSACKRCAQHAWKRRSRHAGAALCGAAARALLSNEASRENACSACAPCGACATHGARDAVPAERACCAACRQQQCKSVPARSVRVRAAAAYAKNASAR